MMNDVSSILLKRFRRMRPRGFLFAAAVLLIFTDFFHFAFHEAPARNDIACAFSFPADGGSEAIPDDPSSAHHDGFCPVCEGILISDGPPVSSDGLSFPAYVSDPVFTGIDSCASIAFLLPQGRAPPRASLS